MIRVIFCTHRTSSNVFVSSSLFTTSPNTPRQSMKTFHTCLTSKQTLYLHSHHTLKTLVNTHQFTTLNNKSSNRFNTPSNKSQRFYNVFSTLDDPTTFNTETAIEECPVSVSKLKNIQLTSSEISWENARPLSEMPGPGGLSRLPYIGILFQFKPFTPFSLQTYGKLTCHLHDRHGPVFKSRIGKNYAVHTCNVEDIQRIFRNEPKFPERRIMNLARIYRERNGLPQGLGSCHGEQWYALRKPLNVALKRPKAASSYTLALNNVGEDFVARLLDIQGENQIERAEAMFKLFFRFTSEGIGVACFNQRLGFLSRDLAGCPDKNKLLEAFKISVECSFKDIMGMERRYLKTDKDPFYLKYVEAMTYIRQQSLKSVEKVLAEDADEKGGSNGEHSNLLKTLARRDDLEMEQVLAIIDSLLVAGTDSTARILSVLLYDMALNPDIQERVAREVRAYAGSDDSVTSECIDKVPLLRACVKESMRIHYPVASGLERTLSEDMVISGYRVPKGTSVLTTGVRTCQDANHFPNPHQFQPDRWLRAENRCKFKSIDNSNSNMDSNRGAKASASNAKQSNRSSTSAFAFIPFGHGARSCIGSRFAELELQVGIAKILQHLEVSVHPSYESLDVIYTPFITPVKPIPFLFKKRP